ncbi:MAG: hypothetical protein HFF49_11580 [Lawsonibacter sp.]|jgi:hypothetical protein|nr:hypothetical protein [Lawsonibacter sp.]
MMQAEPLAREEVLLSQNTLLVNLRFLDAALSQFALTPSPPPFATDGQRLYYDPRHVLLRYKECDTAKLIIKNRQKNGEIG